MNLTLALLLLLMAAPAWADTTPRLLPRHDVSVTYQVSGAAAEAIPALGGSGAAGELRLSWDAAHQKLLVTPAGRPQRMIIDLPGHVAIVLDEGMHMALSLPMRDTDVQAMTMAGARFTRRGQAVVAGEACSDWAVQAKHTSGTVCLTDDGVPLRGEGEVNGRHGAFTATAVDHAGARPADFTVPAGFNRLELPKFGAR